MRMVKAATTAAILLAGLTVGQASAQEMDGDLHSASPKPKAWWGGWFSPAEKPVEKKADTATLAPAGPSAAERAAVARQREKMAYFRRGDVCDLLMAIAVKNNDEAMQTQIEQLKDRAWDLYQQRIAAVPVSGALSVDEAALDRKTGLMPVDKTKKEAGHASFMREANR